jgi:hypothetical protein
LIVAEEGLARGARVLICLALPQHEFERRSVELPGSDWVSRFRKVLKVAEVRLLSDEIGAVPDDDEVFAVTNQWMVEVARSIDPTPHAVIVRTVRRVVAPADFGIKDPNDASASANSTPSTRCHCFRASDATPPMTSTWTSISRGSSTASRSRSLVAAAMRPQQPAPPAGTRPW